MKVTRGYVDEGTRAYPVGTIGNFDGHHVGHHALLRRVIDSARKSHGTAMVVTFDPHPVKILAPQVDLRFLTSPEEKLARFEAAGIDEVVFLEFTPAFATLSPEIFAEKVLFQSLGLKEIFVGQHFAFGHKRAGKIADLISLGEQSGCVVHPLPPVSIEGQVVSSTRIRQLVLAGQVHQAARLLGHHYSLSQVVSSGAGRGHALGCPTANLRLSSDRVIPADGIYATVATIEGKRYDSVSYIGRRPTFDAGERLLEVSVLEGIHELYGKRLSVEFIDRIRDDMMFDSEEALRQQITLDVESAQRVLRQYHQTL